MASRHPILGVGINNHILFSNSNKSSHNAYTQVASEMGVAAALLYILFMLLAPFKGLRRIERKTMKLTGPSIPLRVDRITGESCWLHGGEFFRVGRILWYIYYLVAYAVCLRRLYDLAVEREMASAPQ